MATSVYTVGFVCSGNTCRSPVAAAWLEHALTQSNCQQEVTIWTAGLRVETPGSKVETEALEAAKAMHLSPEMLVALGGHLSRELTCEHRKTDLLVWITDPAKINAIDSGSESRATEMRRAANRLGSVLLVIPEADEAWEAKQNPALQHQVATLYRDQAANLQKWIEIIRQFIPVPIQESRA